MIGVDASGAVGDKVFLQNASSEKALPTGMGERGVTGPEDITSQRNVRGVIGAGVRLKGNEAVAVCRRVSLERAGVTCWVVWGTIGAEAVVRARGRSTGCSKSSCGDVRT